MSNKEVDVNVESYELLKSVKLERQNETTYHYFGRWFLLVLFNIKCSITVCCNCKKVDASVIVYEPISFANKTCSFPNTTKFREPS